MPLPLNAPVLPTATESLPPRAVDPGPAAPISFTATVRWEEYRAPTYRTTTITRHLSLHLAPGAEAGERVLDLRASGHQVRQEENQQPVAPEPVEAWAQRLAALYAWVRVRVGANGEWGEVLNHAAIAQAWTTLRAELLAESPAGEPLLARLLATVDRQVADPQAVRRSLRYDYLYQALAGGWPAPPPLPSSEAEAWSAGQPRGFAAFLPGTDLWFAEQARAASAETGTPALAVRGTLDPARTDLSAGLPPAEAADPLPHAGYEARIGREAATGLPTQLELTVYVRRGTSYNKQYTLTLARV